MRQYKMFKIYPLNRIVLSSVDFTLQEFIDDSSEDTYIKRYFFKKNFEEKDSDCIDGSIGYSYFNELIDCFPLLSTDYTNGLIVIKSSLDLFDEDSLKFLIEEDDNHTFETKILENGFRVIVVDNLPCIYYQIIDSTEYRKVIVGFAKDHMLNDAGAIPLAYHPSNLLDDVVLSFSKYTENNMIDKIKEYFDINGVEYVNV